MIRKRKKPEKDLRSYYTIILQTGLIITLLLSITAVKVQWTPAREALNLTQEQEVVKMEDVIQTRQEEKPPPPPRPQVPVEVPDDEIIEDQDIHLDADINFDDPLDMPPPPDDEDEQEEEFFVAVEEMPELVGGLEELHKRIQYPDRARRVGIEGRVIVQFIVNENGKVENPRILRSIGGGCDEEAIRVIKESTFKPGKQRGNPVPVQVAQTIFFRLQN